MSINVTYTTTRKGPTWAEVGEAKLKEWAEAVLADHRATPDQFKGKARNDGTPFHDTGELIRGFFFKPASATGRKSGLLGTIRAPKSRFRNPRVRDKFCVYLWQLWNSRGVGWSVGGK